MKSAVLSHFPSVGFHFVFFVTLCENFSALSSFRESRVIRSGLLLPHAATKRGEGVGGRRRVMVGGFPQKQRLTSALSVGFFCGKLPKSWPVAGWAETSGDCP
jgi:hypothetical protein